MLALLAGLFLALPGLPTRPEAPPQSDLRFRLGALPLAQDVGRLGSDDASERRLDKWPLKRSAYAQVLDSSADGEVSVVAYDIVLNGLSSAEKQDPADPARETAEPRSGRVASPVGVGLVQEPEVLRPPPKAGDLPLLPPLLPPGQARGPARR